MSTLTSAAQTSQAHLRRPHKSRCALTSMLTNVGLNLRLSHKTRATIKNVSMRNLINFQAKFNSFNVHLTLFILIFQSLVVYCFILFILVSPNVSLLLFLLFLWAKRERNNIRSRKTIDTNKNINRKTIETGRNLSLKEGRPMDGLKADLLRPLKVFDYLLVIVGDLLQQLRLILVGNSSNLRCPTNDWRRFIIKTLRINVNRK